MTADEMFDELGYKMQLFGHSRIGYSKVLDFEGFCVKIIEFDKRKKLIRFDGTFYTAQEIQAINKKCEELKWI